MDWDNNGNNDLLVGDGDGNVFIYRNTNNNTNPILDSGTLVLNNADDRATPVFEDWNGDGYKDLLVGNLTGNIQVYINGSTDAAAPYFSSYSNLLVGGSTFDIGSRAAPRIYDWNRDGLKDIIAGEYNGYVYYLKNTGTVDSNNIPVFNSAEKLLLLDSTPLRYINNPASTVPRSRIDIVDWNNDGLPDIISGGNDGRVMLFTAAPEPMSTTLFLVGSGVLVLSTLKKKIKDRSK